MVAVPRNLQDAQTKASPPLPRYCLVGAGEGSNEVDGDSCRWAWLSSLSNATMIEPQVEFDGLLSAAAPVCPLDRKADGRCQIASWQTALGSPGKARL